MMLNERDLDGWVADENAVLLKASSLTVIIKPSAWHLLCAPSVAPLVSPNYSVRQEKTNI